ncbi:MAG: hypothetical protein EOO28_20890 [Comamonadaceae bacterium]|nr:MAG: hypothetical protein EOO28_20890 [Comamonadaceae bacterium]
MTASSYTRSSPSRRLQQQPQRPDNRQQQQSSGDGEFQPVRRPHPEMSVQSGQMGQMSSGGRRSGQH